MSLVLNVEILGEFKQLTAATKGAQSQLQQMNTKAANISKKINSAFMAIGVGFSLRLITNQLEEAGKAAVEDVKSQELLANQLRNTTGASDEQIASVEKSIKQMMLASNVADDQLRPAFAQLTRATSDVGESTKLMKLALDISAGSGKDLTSVSMALTKAYNGNFGALGKLGIPMTDSIQNASLYAAEMKKLNKMQMDANAAFEAGGANSTEYKKAIEKVTDQQDKLNRISEAGIDWQSQLGDAFKGAADKAANADPYARMQIIFGEMQETIGMALLPSLEKFSTWLATPEGQEKLQGIIDLVTGLVGKFEILASWAIDNAEFVTTFAGAIVGLTLAYKAFTAGLAIYNTIAGIAAARTAAAAVANGTFAATATAATGAAVAWTAALGPLAIALGVALAAWIAYDTGTKSNAAITAATGLKTGADGEIKGRVFAAPGFADKLAASKNGGTTNNVTVNVKTVQDAQTTISQLTNYGRTNGTSLQQLLGK